MIAHVSPCDLSCLSCDSRISLSLPTTTLIRYSKLHPILGDDNVWLLLHHQRYCPAQSSDCDDESFISDHKRKEFRVFTPRFPRSPQECSPSRHPLPAGLHAHTLIPGSPDSRHRLPPSRLLISSSHSLSRPTLSVASSGPRYSSPTSVTLITAAGNGWLAVKNRSRRTRSGSSLGRSCGCHISKMEEPFLFPSTSSRRPSPSFISSDGSSKSSAREPSLQRTRRSEQYA